MTAPASILEMACPMTLPSGTGPPRPREQASEAMALVVDRTVQGRVVSQTR